MISTLLSSVFPNTLSKTVEWLRLGKIYLQDIKDMSTGKIYTLFRMSVLIYIQVRCLNK